MEGSPVRRYASEVRAEQSRATRARVLDAARTLFLRRGYTGATIEAIAKRAGVSVQSIYNTVGGKPRLLKAVWDTMLAGDDEPIPIVGRPTFLAMRAAPDPRTLLALYVTMARQFYDRVGPLLPVVLAEGAGGDREVRGFLDTIERERAIGTAGVAAFVHERFGLRAGLSVADAGDILWTLTAPELAIRLVQRCGWSLEKYERWLSRAMADALLGDAASPAENG